MHTRRSIANLASYVRYSVSLGLHCCSVGKTHICAPHRCRGIGKTWGPRPHSRKTEDPTPQLAAYLASSRQVLAEGALASLQEAAQERSGTLRNSEELLSRQAGSCRCARREG